MRKPYWTVVAGDGRRPPTVLPTAVYEAGGLIDVTRVGDGYRRFIHEASGTVHAGDEYAKQMAAELA